MLQNSSYTLDSPPDDIIRIGRDLEGFDDVDMEWSGGMMSVFGMYGLEGINFWTKVNRWIYYWSGVRYVTPSGAPVTDRYYCETHGCVHSETLRSEQSRRDARDLYFVPSVDQFDDK